VDGNLNRKEEFQILLLFPTPRIFVLEVLITGLSLLFIFVDAEDKKSEYSSYSKAWGKALEASPFSFVIFLINFPFLVFTAIMFGYHTYLAMIN
jgi:uncharacterized membrane-anchored protein YitT (DUF2179 family)